ncbi:MAG: polyphosphate kinase 2 family protein, partial [Pseudanabaena sp. SU_2_4]|nr:polyphosphate kinase 2 family protein [Pseudanabaena sp. SU_2_4]
MNPKHFIVPIGTKVKLSEYDPAYTGEFRADTEAEALLQADIKQLAKYQDILYAQNTYALLIIFQAMDAAGKDGTIKHVLSGVNPQGVEVRSFKAPNDEERLHHFLWRSSKALPARGRMTIFNRSYF